ncbi:Ig-like domain-containing protein [Reichenbachiella carrageenanivorans]|uniref:Ig-like domain-containing protein n=1 Tax=Reichenbachiella carrageenanivorans TaxID=2979869 RepID=A0ABY6D6T6_9BACT|nr:Ig-like domain-containing protein [Reichenbachiella carrageenanivorans]UXX81330.1 Ig-like domain-containing protein [Reichenbachiella carrageenanivorans]
MIKLLLLVTLFGACGEESEQEMEDIGKTIYAESIQLTAQDLVTDTQRQITVAFQPVNTTDQSVSWAVSDEAIAEISSTGLLTAKANGSVTVTATANDKGMVTGQVILNITSVLPSAHNDIDVSTVDELKSALNVAEAGDVIVLEGGTYTMTERIVLNTSGTAAEFIVVMAASTTATERPVLDFSNLSEGPSNQGIQLKGDYWHFKGIDIRKAGDNGMQVKGSNNIIEFCSFYENSDTGLQLDEGAADNLILNCDSYFNADSKVENADGFAAKLTVGSGNKFVGCRAWQNLDDGWDGYLRDNDNVKTTYENCWAVKNGFLKSGTEGGGDGNGFKTGGSDGKDLTHNAVYKNCIAAGNVNDGFDHNSNRGTVTLHNCGAYDNGTNYNFSSTNPLSYLEVKNSVAVGTVGSLNASTKDLSHNSWQSPLSGTADDFKRLDIDLLLGDRNADGSLPAVDFMKLKAESDLIDAGVDVGLPFEGTAPDVGPFEQVNE